MCITLHRSRHPNKYTSWRAQSLSYIVMGIALHVLFSLSNTASRFRRQHHPLGTSVNNLALQVMHYRAKPKPEVQREL